MSPIEIAVAGMILLLFFFFLGMPISLAFALSGVIGFYFMSNVEASLSVLAIETFSNLSNYGLTVIPMFVLMGAVGFHGGMSRRLFDFGFTLFGRTRGGLALASVAASAAFAAVCGSTAATAAAIGRVSIPEMKRYGYDDALSNGCVAASGTLGILIPPSATFIVYGTLTELSIGKLFIAGVLPGILLAILFALTVLIWCWYDPKIAPAGPETTLLQKLKTFAQISDMLILLLLVLGGLFLGWFTPTQAGAAGAGGAILIAFVRRSLGWQEFLSALEDTMKTSCMVMVLIAGALIFSRFLAVTGFPRIVSNWVGGLPFSPFTIMLLIILFHFLAGTFMDSFGLILLTVPVLYPTILKLGFDPIWYGVMIILICEMGVISPPEGLNIWVVKSISPDVSLKVIFKGCVPFCVAVLVCAVCLMLFPIIATFLPSFMTY
jgi:C4-dicarboxylate transporter, DctM subunit